MSKRLWFIAIRTGGNITVRSVASETYNSALKMLHQTSTFDEYNIRDFTGQSIWLKRKTDYEQN